MAEDMNVGMKFLIGFVTTLFVVGIVLYAILLSSSALQDTQQTTGQGSASNQTTLFTTTPGTQVFNGTLTDFHFVTLEVRNVTSNVLINSANYATSGGYIIAVSNSTYVGQNVNATYTFTYSVNNEASSAMINFSNGVSTISANIPTFVGIAVVVVIIGLIAVILMYVGGIGIGGRRDSL